ncbi:MAG TPA: 23S rRNA (guanosine(2251)-2'-O)-methyltransferase RlmB [Candidatus Avacidaminococcus intestinavium]|uniref:23S rRNA (Guanosine(2251)-2'-O)-methyltransferase RlmB n=1 Tax=Candidatus Avacidaminococcus intestinavium TaxID=2840684 RepID=A0A9D1SLC4_9FIRM|nr:23S rRNA (guanosine(2251)-2'-O)-methyltransferase RlmB [Candidatus Avacidaminococcus intestinavium]
MTEEIIVGRNSLLEALRSGRSLSRLYITDGVKGGSISEITALAKERGINIEFIKSEKMDYLAGKLRHQGVAALAAPIEFQELETVLKNAEQKNEPPLLILLDELQDAQNVGAIIRTADAVGAHGVLLPKRRSCPLNAAVAKVSAGAIEYVPIVSIGNIVQTIKDLKKKGLWIVGADMDGTCNYYESDLRGPLVVVLGAEGKGLGRLVKDNCDFLVKMPMKGAVNSLNASAAAAVLLYEVVRQRATD